MRISDWSSDVCSSDLLVLAELACSGLGGELVLAVHDVDAPIGARAADTDLGQRPVLEHQPALLLVLVDVHGELTGHDHVERRLESLGVEVAQVDVLPQSSAEHTSELQ